MANDPVGLKIILYRILGNDLPPRHRVGQTYDNLKFILDHEPNFPNCQKKWVVNRIVDTDAEKRIITLLEENKQPFIRIPFNIQEYNVYQERGIRNYLTLIRILLSLFKSKNQIYARLRRLVDILRSFHFDFEKYNKILYVMNNNGARNTALRDGKRLADWVLPFDGNCYFTEDGWKGVIAKLSAQRSTDKYFLVPMYRLSKNEECFDFHPQQYLENEPQVIFGKSTTVEFNENYCYGYSSKLELFQRLGFRLKRAYQVVLITDAEYKCGYVLRLASESADEDTSLDSRYFLRNEAIDLLFQKLDGLCLKNKTSLII